MLRRSRIVATLGPATDREGMLDAILRMGVDVARINFSHGTAEQHLLRIASLRRAAEKLNRPVAVLADLPGPKLRALLPKPLELQVGQKLTFATNPQAKADVSVTESEPMGDVRLGQRILLDDGRLQVRALHISGNQLVTEVVVGGVLQPNKGINLPETELSIAAITTRDREALATAAQAGVDWLALSFVRSADAAQQLRVAAKQHGLEVPILAKMERPESVKNAYAIIEAFDGIMVARGDLGVELPLEQVPHIQKRLINQARAAGKPVVTATDMLDSMRGNPRPTRAEASDVANAIYDGTDAIMLSGETAIGDYPVEAVAYMDRIAKEAESHLRETHQREVILPRGEIEDHITSVTCALAWEIKADAIITPTVSGRTARLVARHRPATRIIAASRHESVLRQMSLIWGVQAVLLDGHLKGGEDRLDASVRSAFARGAVKAGDLAIVLAGHPIEGGEIFPTIRVVRIGNDGRCWPP